MYEERKKKSAERKQTKTKLPSECQQETNEKKNKKQPSFKERTKTDFVKRDYYHNKKIQKNQN